MTKEEAKRVLEIMACADGGCISCVREIFIQFIKEFQEFSDLAKSIFKEKFDEELLDESNKREILRYTIGNVLKEHQVEPLRTVFFGSRARDDFDKDSDWDVLVVVKERLTRKEKEKISEMIRKRLARFLIPCDIIVKYVDKLTLYENFYGTATYEALKEGIPL